MVRFEGMVVSYSRHHQPVYRIGRLPHRRTAPPRFLSQVEHEDYPGKHLRLADMWQSGTISDDELEWGITWFVVALAKSIEAFIEHQTVHQRLLALQPYTAWADQSQPSSSDT